MIGWLNRKPQMRNFEIDADEAGTLSRHGAGIRTIPVDQIVGSVGRYHELQSNFMPILSPHGDGRFQRVVSAMRDGTPLPPIDVFKLRDRYYVVDGHHRVAAARKLGQVAIDAVVTEFSPATVPQYAVA